MPAPVAIPVRPRRNQEAPQSLAGYCTQGAAFLGFMLFLFWMAGLKL